MPPTTYAEAVQEALAKVESPAISVDFVKAEIEAASRVVRSQTYGRVGLQVEDLINGNLGLFVYTRGATVSLVEISLVNFYQAGTLQHYVEFLAVVYGKGVTFGDPRARTQLEFKKLLISLLSSVGFGAILLDLQRAVVAKQQEGII